MFGLLRSWAFRENLSCHKVWDVHETSLSFELLRIREQNQGEMFPYPTNKSSFEANSCCVEKKTSVYPDDITSVCIWTVEQDQDYDDDDDEDEEGVGYSSDVARKQQEQKITLQLKYGIVWFSRLKLLSNYRRLQVSPVENCYTIDIRSTRRSVLCKSIVCNDWIKPHEPTSGLAAEIRVYTTAHFRTRATAKRSSTYWTKSHHPFPNCLYLYGTHFQHQTGSIYRPIFTGTPKMLIDTHEQKEFVFY